jgi:hypothetical protein
MHISGTGSGAAFQQVAVILLDIFISVLVAAVGIKL